METVKTYTKEIGSDVYKLDVKRSEVVNQTLYVMYCERGGVEIKGTRVVRQRLSAADKSFFSVNAKGWRFDLETIKVTNGLLEVKGMNEAISGLMEEVSKPEVQEAIKAAQEQATEMRAKFKDEVIELAVILKSDLKDISTAFGLVSGAGCAAKLEGGIVIRYSGYKEEVWDAALEWLRTQYVGWKHVFNVSGVDVKFVLD